MRQLFLLLLIGLAVRPAWAYDGQAATYPPYYDRFSVGLATYLKLDEGAGTSAADSNGLHTGTLVNTPVWAAGIAGQALTFTGASSQRVSLANAAPIGNNGAFTLNAWIKSSDAGTTGLIFYAEAIATSLNPRMFFNLNDGTAGSIGFGMLDDAGTDGFFQTGNIGANDGIFHMVTFVQTSKSKRDIFMDGVWRLGKANVTLGACSPTNANIGVMQNNNTFNNYFTGTVDQLRIYNVALSTAQIVDLYKAQR